MGVLRKKEAFTLCTPIPAFVPRQLALDVLHSHDEVLRANPLVLEHRAIPAPAHAQPDEARCAWYEIAQRIQYVPGLGSMGAGKISFTGCFHDVPWGLQTHTYAPMGVDLRNTYRVAGYLPGVEPAEARELGLAAAGAPDEGLYLRADVEIECSVGFAGFVRSQTRGAIDKMVARMIKRAEEMDADALQEILAAERHPPPPPPKPRSPQREQQQQRQQQQQQQQQPQYQQHTSPRQYQQYQQHSPTPPPQQQYSPHYQQQQPSPQYHQQPSPQYQQQPSPQYHQQYQQEQPQVPELPASAKAGWEPESHSEYPAEHPAGHSYRRADTLFLNDKQ